MFEKAYRNKVVFFKLLLFFLINFHLKKKVNKLIIDTRTKFSIYARCVFRLQDSSVTLKSKKVKKAK